MSKRARLTLEEAKKAGLTAWETPEGRRWLLKSLNPNDVSVVTSGIPTLHSRNISILNWQGEYSVNVPSNITEAIPTYDTTMFLYQHPLIFGMSASRPNGCLDMRDVNGTFHITRENANAPYKYKLAISTSAGKPISMTSCSQYLNNQIDPVVFNGDKSLAGRRKLFRQLTQKNRIAYGGATIIPTCSSENDSGSLAVCQQVFSPRKTVIETNTNIELDTFMDNDFPNTSDLVQNPQMYYGRYKDGAYIPYKMNDPSSTNYVGSEQEMTTRAPYFVKDVAFIGCSAADGDANVAAIREIMGSYSGVANNNFQVSCGTDLYHLLGIRLYIQSYTGQTAHVTLTLGNLASLAAGNSKMFYTDDGVTAKALSTHYGATALIEGATPAKANIGELELNDLYLKLPTLITNFQWSSATADNSNPIGLAWISMDISSDVNAEAELKRGTICPYNGQSLITIHMSGVSNTAPIKMLLRYGAEILLVASSAYSPFKFMSPKYDESAIKSYARCIRSMKDAYFANAGSVVGQADYTNKLMNLIENDSPDELNRTLNQGGGWTGVVGAY